MNWVHQNLLWISNNLTIDRSLNTLTVIAVCLVHARDARRLKTLRLEAKWTIVRDEGAVEIQVWVRSWRRWEMEWWWDTVWFCWLANCRGTECRLRLLRSITEDIIDVEGRWVVRRWCEDVGDATVPVTMLHYVGLYFARILQFSLGCIFSSVHWSAMQCPH